MIQSDQSAAYIRMKDMLLEFRVQILSEEAVSTNDDISETKVLRDTEVDSLFVFKTAAE